MTRKDTIIITTIHEWVQYCNQIIIITECISITYANSSLVLIQY